MSRENLPSFLLEPSSFVDRFDPKVWMGMPPITLDNLKQSPGLLYQFFTSAGGYTTLVVFALAVMVVILVRSSNASNEARRGDADMRKWERQRQVQKITSDLLTEIIEEARYRDLLSKGEKHHLYKGLAHFFELPDLLAKRSPARKKAEIAARRKAGLNTKPSPIPGDPPPPVQRREVTKPVRKRGMISQIVAASKAAAL